MKAMRSGCGGKGSKMEKTMRAYKEGDLHSGSDEGPVVKSKKQAVAIGLSEMRRSGGKRVGKK